MEYRGSEVFGPPCVCGKSTSDRQTHDGCLDGPIQSEEIFDVAGLRIMVLRGEWVGVIGGVDNKVG